MASRRLRDRDHRREPPIRLIRSQLDLLLAIDKEDDGISCAELSRRFGVHFTTMSCRLRWMVARGLVRRSVWREHTRWHITEEGDRLLSRPAWERVG